MYNNYDDGPSGKTILFLTFLLVCLLASCSRSCSDQAMTKNWGGTMEVELEPNTKLINVTWKEDSLWYLTREMKEDDVAESYVFQEKDVTGWLEGSVYIHEIKLSPDELEKYQEQKVLEKDFQNASNVSYDGRYLFIEYDANTNTYIKIQDYTYGENGSLIQIE